MISLRELVVNRSMEMLVTLRKHTALRSSDVSLASAESIISKLGATAAKTHTSSSSYVTVKESEYRLMRLKWVFVEKRQGGQPRLIPDHSFLQTVADNEVLSSFWSDWKDLKITSSKLLDDMMCMSVLFMNRLANHKDSLETKSDVARFCTRFHLDPVVYAVMTAIEYKNSDNLRLHVLSQHLEKIEGIEVLIDTHSVYVVPIVIAGTQLLLPTELASFADRFDRCVERCSVDAAQTERRLRSNTDHLQNVTIRGRALRCNASTQTVAILFDPAVIVQELDSILFNSDHVHSVTKAIYGKLKLKM